MVVEELETTSPEATACVGARLAAHVAGGGVVWLEGPLGAGKTLLAKALFGALGADPHRVTSPTFTLLNRYREAQPGLPALWHVDLYRTTGEADLETIGLDEVLDSGAVVVIEWAEKLGARWPPPDVRVTIHDAGGDRRLLRVAIAGRG